MSTLWLFGDSFTAEGKSDILNNTPSGSLTWDDEVYKRQSFGNDLGRLISASNVQNLSRSGCSNFVILDTLLTHINDIQPYDTVFIGTTRYERYTYCSPKSVNRVEPINWGTRHELQRTRDKDDDYVTSAHVFKDMDHDKIEEIITFFTNHNVDEDSHIVTHNSIVCDRIRDIHNLLNYRLNIKSFLWGCDLWGYPRIEPIPWDKDVDWGPNNIFETVYTWTNKLVEDGHWSPNGDLLAAHFFKYCFDKKINNITVQVLADWYMSHGKYFKQELEYIKFNKDL